MIKKSVCDLVGNIVAVLVDIIPSFARCVVEMNLKPAIAKCITVLST